jgi:lysophospholipase L1-like esterase
LEISADPKTFLASAHHYHLCLVGADQYIGANFDPFSVYLYIVLIFKMTDPQKTSLPRLGFEIMAVLFFSLLIVEVCLRVYLNHHFVYDVEMAKYSMTLKQDSPDPLIDHVLKPDASVKLMGVWVRTNSEGFRGRDCPIPRSQKKRVLFLGDSFLFGWGVEEQNIFPSILERHLSQIYPTEIINAGMFNYNTEQETHLFIQKGLKYHPDKVVVFWGINDTRLTAHRSKWWFLGYSEFFTLCWSISHIMAENLDPAKRYQPYYSGLYQEGLPGLARAKAAFLLLKDICFKNHISLQVVLVPELHDLMHYPFKKEHRMMEEFLQNNKIDVLDLTPFFANWKNPTELWVAIDDAHPNKTAHQLIARYTVDFIKKGLYGTGQP